MFVADTSKDYNLCIYVISYARNFSDKDVHHEKCKSQQGVYNEANYIKMTVSGFIFSVCRLYKLHVSGNVLIGNYVC